METGAERLSGIIEVRVEWGDTLWDLSRRLGLDHWHGIQVANGLKDDLIFAGEVLKVPLPSTVSMTGCRWRRQHAWPWVVQSGDTAWDISERFSIGLEDLESANSCLLDLLYPGDIMQVPEKDSTLKEVTARSKVSGDSSSKPNFFDVFPAPKAYAEGWVILNGLWPDIDEYRKKHRILLNALREVESSFIMPAPTGDGGLSIGPLQISREYHTDAWWLTTHDVNYESCNNVDYSERTVIKYWLRYCPWALEFSDFETLARTHNGGPQFWQFLSTTHYWKRVRRSMKRFGHRQGFPAFTAGIGNQQFILLFSTIIPFPIPMLDSKVMTSVIVS